MSIKAIETVYKDHRFRSRTEARWAVFFDTLDVEWEYEKEGYRLDGNNLYLPDFWLPCANNVFEWSGYWLEIKGISPKEKEISLASNLAKFTKHTTFIAYGLPGENQLIWFHESGDKFSGESNCLFSSFIPEIGNVAPLLCHYLANGMDWMNIGKAIKAAKQARFEHGQFGPPEEWLKSS